MLRIKTSEKKEPALQYPLAGYFGYGVMKFFDKMSSLSILLGRVETLIMKSRIKEIDVIKPIYITGLARAGTTIVLEMLSNHADVATHKYKHLFLPYTPRALSVFIRYNKLYTKPQERIHRDGIFINRESPEAVEEMLWEKFFPNLHEETCSNIIEKTDFNPKFDTFYKNHIRKLLFNQNRSRYVTKNNYSMTRLDYILRLFPDAKFLVIIRNPINHIASSIKQTELFMLMEKENPLLIEWERISGHHEFGHNQSCINTGNPELISKIRALWRNKQTRVEGWAYYWSSIYDYIADLLESNEKLKKATLVVSHDDLCENSAEIIGKIIKHAELSSQSFEDIKNEYVKKLHRPSYYNPNFSKQELESIHKITGRTYARYENLK